MADKNELKMLKMLLHAGADPNLLDKNNASPLMRAIDSCEPAMVKYLLSHGAMVGLKRVFNKHELFLAIRQGNLVRVRYVFKKYSADLLKYRNKGGDTALHIAAEFGQTAIASFLLKTGADINRKNNSGDTALHLSVLNRKKNTVALLIKKGADVNVRNNSGETPLHGSVWCKSLVEKLIDAGADVDARDNFGDSPLNHAIESECYSVVEFLIQSGTQFSTKGFYGQSSLHKSVH
ncbi:MAG: ankyrin repeat domain-containing protein, partial [Lentisphaeraceae bacterium]|nr:ankyrin repeat domain-containing protein [Lentisphaeraceae bacterium]